MQKLHSKKKNWQKYIEASKVIAFGRNDKWLYIVYKDSYLAWSSEKLRINKNDEVVFIRENKRIFVPLENLKRFLTEEGGIGSDREMTRFNNVRLNC